MTKGLHGIVARYALLLLLCAAWDAHALITCTASVSAISTFFNPASPAGLTTSGSWSVNCTRALSDPNSVTFDLEADLGGNFTGQQRRVQFAGSTYDYDLFRSNSTQPNQRWAGKPNRQFSGTINFGASTSGTTGPQQYFFNMPGGQTVMPAGLYTDQVAVTLTYGTVTALPVTLFISITSITNCTVSKPASLVFNYTSFGAQATPSTNFVVNCTTGLPYTVTLDNIGPITDNVVNLIYSLSLSSTPGVSSVAASGSGTNQAYSVFGTMAAGQGGTCATLPCNNNLASNKTRTITVTY